MIVMQFIDMCDIYSQLFDHFATEYLTAIESRIIKYVKLKNKIFLLSPSCISLIFSYIVFLVR